MPSNVAYSLGDMETGSNNSGHHQLAGVPWNQQFLTASGTPLLNLGGWRRDRDRWTVVNSTVGPICVWGLPDGTFVGFLDDSANPLTTPPDYSWSDEATMLGATTECP